MSAFMFTYGALLLYLGTYVVVLRYDINGVYSYVII